MPDNAMSEVTAVPNLEDFEAMAKAAYRSIPDELRRHVDGVVIRVADWPDPETLDAMGISSPFGLLGLYRGVSLKDKSPSHPLSDVDLIFLYRRPILEYWSSAGGELEHLVRHVLIHEIGHHFGFSDDDMHGIETRD